MKKKGIINIALNFCLSAALLFNLSNAAVSGFYDADGEEALQSGDWLYYDRGDHISVCGYSGSEVHITVPSKINGKEVTEVERGNDYANFFVRYEMWDDFESAINRIITIPETVKRIGDYTFRECFSLTQADLPEGLIAIGDYAFAYCRLTEAEIPDSVKYIGNNAFTSTAVTSVNLPEGLEYIGGNAFSNTKITRAEIPDTVKYLGESAFSHCYSLESVKLPNGMRSIPNSLFFGCLSLKSVEIPEGVSVIGVYAFSFCTGLEEIHIPSTVISLSHILTSNNSLKDIYFAADKETVKKIKTTANNNFEAAASYNLDLMTVMKADYDDTDYSNVTIHYGEKREAEEKTAEPLINTVFTILTAVFAAAFIIFLCLYILQKSKNKPAESVSEPLRQSSTSISQGNLLTSCGSTNAILCGKCGAESGKNANYCYNCGKKLTGKPSKTGGRERKK